MNRYNELAALEAIRDDPELDVFSTQHAALEGFVDELKAIINSMVSRRDKKSNSKTNTDAYGVMLKWFGSIDIKTLKPVSGTVTVSSSEKILFSRSGKDTSISNVAKEIRKDVAALTKAFDQVNAKERTFSDALNGLYKQLQKSSVKTIDDVRKVINGTRVVPYPEPVNISRLRLLTDTSYAENITIKNVTDTDIKLLAQSINQAIKLDTDILLAEEKLSYIAVDTTAPPLREFYTSLNASVDTAKVINRYADDAAINPGITVINKEIEKLLNKSLSLLKRLVKPEDS